MASLLFALRRRRIWLLIWDCNWNWKLITKCLINYSISPIIAHPLTQNSDIHHHTSLSLYTSVSTQHFYAYEGLLCAVQCLLSLATTHFPFLIRNHMCYFLKYMINIAIESPFNKYYFAIICTCRWILDCCLIDSNLSLNDSRLVPPVWGWSQWDMSVSSNYYSYSRYAWLERIIDFAFYPNTWS